MVIFHPSAAHRKQSNMGNRNCKEHRQTVSEDFLSDLPWARDGGQMLDEDRHPAGVYVPWLGFESLPQGE